MSKWITSLLLVFGLSAQTSLNSFLRNVAEKNLRIKANYLAYKKQASTFYTTILPNRPELSFERNEIKSGESFNSANEKTLSIKQEFEFPLNYYYKAQKASLTKKIAYQSYLDKSLKILLSAKKEFSKYSILRMKQRLVNEFVKRYSLVLTHMKKMKEAGEISEMALLRISLEYEGLLNEQRNFETSIVEQKERLKLFLPSFKFKKFEDEKIDSTLTRFEVKSELERMLPTLQKSKLLHENSKTNSTLSYLTRLPNFAFTYRKQEIERVVYSGFELSLSIPLWIPKEIEELQVRKIERESALLNLDFNTVRIEQFFESRWKKYINDFSNWNRFKHSLLPKSEHVFNNAQKQYEAGEISYFVFIDNYRVWKNIRLSELDQRLTLLNTISELRQSKLLNFLKKEDE